jgi:S1-C subfamily serine protease
MRAATPAQPTPDLPIVEHPAVEPPVPAPTSATPTRVSVRSRTWARPRSAVTLAVTALSFTLLASGGVASAAAPASVAGPRTFSATSVPAIGLVDSGGGQWYGGGRWGNGGTNSGDGSGAGSGTSTETVDSRVATKAESQGVALIDTVLGYEDASAAGTGIILTSDGEVLTNYHVVQGATSIKVTIATTATTYTAQVVGHDETDDVALLKLKGASSLTTATVDDDAVTTGDQVTAVGNAGGTDHLTAAEGKVTALGKTITTESEDGGADETLTHLIVTDADVVPGDSGGPLLDSDGEVVGIDTAASSGSEIDGYAIGIKRALSVVKQIRSGGETTSVQIGAGAYLGVQVSDTSSEETNGYPSQDPSWDDSAWGDSGSGALVAGVLAGTPAAKAGLEEGDTLTKVGSTTVTSADDVAAALQSYDAGQSATITWVDSAGADQSASVTLATSPVA